MSHVLKARILLLRICNIISILFAFLPAQGAEYGSHHLWLQHLSAPRKRSIHFIFFYQNKTKSEFAYCDFLHHLSQCEKKFQCCNWNNQNMLILKIFLKTQLQVKLPKLKSLNPKLSRTVKCFHKWKKATESVHLYLVDDGIVPENVTHWQHHAVVSASLHNRCAVFCSCLESCEHISVQGRHECHTNAIIERKRERRQFLYFRNWRHSIFPQSALCLKEYNLYAVWIKSHWNVMKKCSVFFLKCDF